MILFPQEATGFLSTTSAGEGKAATVSRSASVLSVDGRYQYDSVVLCLDDYTARIVVEVLKTSKLFLALQHRAADEEIVIQRPYLPGVAQSFESFLPRNSNPPAAPTAANNQAWHGNTYSANPVPSPTPSPTTVIYPWQSVVK